MINVFLIDKFQAKPINFKYIPESDIRLMSDPLAPLIIKLLVIHKNQNS